jgi:cytochrome c oxidase cbb3-type subunit 3
MKNLVIAGVALVLFLIAGTYVIYDNFGADLEGNYINLLTLVGAVAIIVIAVGVSLKYVNQIKNDTADGELADESWDGIGEYKNELPIGWAVTFFALIIWQAWYWLIGYPTSQFSQIGQWNEEVSVYNEKFESAWADISDEELVAMGESLFLVQCAPCHGETADGMAGKAANLNKRLEKDVVAHVIKNGSAGLGNEVGQLGYGMGMMPDRNGIVNMMTGMPISDADIDTVSSFVAAGLPASDAKGMEMFTNYCSSCHGADGKGMDGMSPNLVAFDKTLIDAVLNNGKKGNIGSMPAFKGRLSQTQYDAARAYINSLGE